MRHALVAGVLFWMFFVVVAEGQPIGDQTQFPPTYIPSGAVMYKQFCAACHGADAKGNDPAASMLKTQPPDLTILAKHHLGKFPYEYVSAVLRFGPGPSAHGSSDMPTWGPIFQIIDKGNERAVQRCSNASRTSATIWHLWGRNEHPYGRQGQHDRLLASGVTSLGC